MRNDRKPEKTAESGKKSGFRNILENDNPILRANPSLETLQLRLNTFEDNFNGNIVRNDRTIAPPVARVTPRVEITRNNNDDGTPIYFNSTTIGDSTIIRPTINFMPPSYYNDPAIAARVDANIAAMDAALAAARSAAAMVAASGPAENASAADERSAVPGRDTPHSASHASATTNTATHSSPPQQYFSQETQMAALDALRSLGPGTYFYHPFFNMDPLRNQLANIDRAVNRLVDSAVTPANANANANASALNSGTEAMVVSDLNPEAPTVYPRSETVIYEVQESNRSERWKPRKVAKRSEEHTSVNSCKTADDKATGDRDENNDDGDDDDDTAMDLS